MTGKNDDPYVYPGTHILKNKLEIKDPYILQIYEHKVTLSRIGMLNEQPLRGNFDFQHLCLVHKHIFQDVYEWAGEPRKIGIIKSEPLLNGNTIRYPHPDQPGPENMFNRANYTFEQLHKDNLLKDLGADAFVKRLAHHSAEIWEVHPFRDGNTRTTIVFSDHLARNAGYPPLGAAISERTGDIRDAFVRAAWGKPERLQELLGKALELSLSQNKPYQSRLKREKEPDLER